MVAAADVVVTHQRQPLGSQDSGFVCFMFTLSVTPRGGDLIAFCTPSGEKSEVLFNAGDTSCTQLKVARGPIHVLKTV